MRRKGMAHRLLRLRSTARGNKAQDLRQRFEYLLVLDFEATCEKDTRLKPQEIIELPCLVLSTKTWEVKDAFHEYVKPRINPELTSYCTDLTGIIQEMLDDRPPFSETFVEFQRWLEDGGYSRDASLAAFVTCGDWDLRVMLPEQCAIDGIDVPSNFHQWINLKKSFLEATGYYPRSLGDMLRHLNLPLQGRLHSGIQDVHNMTRVIQYLGTRRNANFDITSRMHEQ